MPRQHAREAHSALPLRPVEPRGIPGISGLCGTGYFFLGSDSFSCCFRACSSFSRSILAVSIGFSCCWSFQPFDMPFAIPCSSYFLFDWSVDLSGCFWLCSNFSRSIAAVSLASSSCCLFSQSELFFLFWADPAVRLDSRSTIDRFGQVCRDIWSRTRDRSARHPTP